MKLLIVEDEATLQKTLKKGFTKLGYSVDTAGDGVEALERYYSAEYDVIVLDLNLPKMDGIEVLKQIRLDSATVNVIILSARNELDDRILGLDTGANDYLGKPFHFKELEARVRALSRRAFSLKESVISFAPELTLNTTLKTLSFQGTEIDLTRKEYAVLEYLALHKGNVISGEELMEHVWDSTTDAFSNAFKVHLSSLRKKLPLDTIKNKRGWGYYVE